MSVYMQAYIHTCTHTFMHAHIYTCTQIYRRAHTHAHTMTLDSKVSVFMNSAPRPLSTSKALFQL